MNQVIMASGLQKVYLSGENKTYAVRDISLNISNGESVAITGPSGCGKTTLINMIGLVIKPTQGKLLINSVDSADLSHKQRAEHRNRVFGYIVQDYALIEDFTAYHNVEIPLLYSRERIKRKEQKRRVLEALNQVGLTEKAFTKAKNLSGGERQRVAIARAIVNSPHIILADEPTGSLDSKNAEEVIQLLKKLVSEGKTLIMVTHDQVLAEQCNRQIRIVDGMEADSPEQ